MMDNLVLFFAVRAALLEQVGPLPAFAAALVAALMIQGVSLWTLRRSG